MTTAAFLKNAYHARQPGGGSNPGQGLPFVDDEVRDKAPEEEQFLRCRACRSIITSASERFAVQGGHEHTFANPSGLLFRIGCFRSAAGCVCTGDTTAEWSWFAGFSWSIALCAGCMSHVGWRYEAPSQAVFFGLILDRLFQDSP